MPKTKHFVTQLRTNLFFFCFSFNDLTRDPNTFIECRLYLHAHNANESINIMSFLTADYEI